MDVKSRSNINKNNVFRGLGYNPLHRKCCKGLLIERSVEGDSPKSSLDDSFVILR